MIKVGRISAVDKDNGMASVVYEDEDDATTDMLPIMRPFLKATTDDHPGPVKHIDHLLFEPPEIGQYVVVALLSTGAEDGVIIGTYHNDDNPPDKE